MTDTDTLSANLELAACIKHQRKKREYFVQPITFRAAQIFVQKYHHYLPRPRTHLFSVSIANRIGVVAVAIVGRPVSASQCDGTTCEIIRLATVPGHKNTASMAIGAAWRTAKALGYIRLISYVAGHLNGESYRAANMKFIWERPRGRWNAPDELELAACIHTTKLFMLSADDQD